MTDKNVLISDSKQRVAYDLMLQISHSASEDKNKKDRSYWLTLYCQCYKATSGDGLSSVLNETQ